MNVGKNIQSLRKKLNMTQQDFAERIGVSRSAISRIEKKPSSDTELLQRISEAFNIPIHTLMYIDESQAFCDIPNPEVLTQINSIRDLYKNSTELYRKLPDRNKSFTRAMGLEIFKEILYCENRAVERFANNLRTNLELLFTEAKDPLAETYLDYITEFAANWIEQNPLDRLHNIK